MRKTKGHLVLGLVSSLLAALVMGCGDNTATTAPASTSAATMAAATTANATTAAATTAVAAATSAAQAGGKPIPSMPTKPVNLQVLDVCGCLQLSQAMMENYKKANPDKVGDIQFLKATAPELPAKLKAQQDANKIDITLVFSGYDGMASGVEQGLWTPLTPDYNAKFSSLTDNYLDPVKKAAAIAQGYGLPFAYTPSGPLFEYDPAKIQTAPKNMEELKTWIKANPKRFFYARPANSGPGRTFIMGLPYLLGDKDPKDPINGWDKTWAFLKEIDPYIEYYPTRTGDTMKELAEGTRWMIASTLGWDINPRALGQVPKEIKTFAPDGLRFVSDGLFMLVPKGLDNDRLAVTLDMMAYILKPEQQAITYDDGYFYPGPAVKGVDVALAPAKSQAVVKEFGRPEYDDLIKKTPVELPLDAKNLVAAFDKWDKEIGGAKLKK